MSSAPALPFKSFYARKQDHRQCLALMLPPYISCTENGCTTTAELIHKEGTCWPVKVMLLSGVELMTDGWSTFIGDIKLSTGELLVFTEVTVARFLVVIYDQDLVERKLMPFKEGSVRENLHRSLSFCKYLVDEHQNDCLMVPKRFVCEGAYVRYSRRVRIESVRRNRVWEMNLQEIDGNYYLTDGWKDFMAENCLTHGDMLRFEVQAETDRWEVWAYNDGGTEKEITPGSWVCISALVDEWRQNRTWLMRPRFVREMTANGLTDKLDLPKKFVERAGLNSESEVELRKARSEIRVSGQRFQVGCRNKERISMGWGWKQFARRYRFNVGDIILFTYLPNSNNVIEVQVLDKTKGTNLLLKASRGGWIPFPWNINAE